MAKPPEVGIVITAVLAAGSVPAAGAAAKQVVQTVTDMFRPKSSDDSQNTEETEN